MVPVPVTVSPVVLVETAEPLAATVHVPEPTAKVLVPTPDGDKFSCPLIVTLYVTASKVPCVNANAWFITIASCRVILPPGLLIGIAWVNVLPALVMV